jgi:hypothetical protein
LVGLVTLSTPDRNSGAYVSLDPAESTDGVLMPLIMHQHFGESTFSSVVNLGFATTVHCEFSDSVYRSSTTLLTDEVFVLPLGELGEGYVGSATIAAVVYSLFTNPLSSSTGVHLHEAFATLSTDTETSPLLSVGELDGGAIR